MNFLNRTTAFFLTVVFLNALYNTTLPLHFDEAYYWLWSKRLAISYFDHPPMVAWLLYLAGFLGDSPFFLRLAPLLCMTAAGFIIWRLAYEAFDRKTADLALLLYSLLPIVHIGFLLATPDAPLCLFWTLSLYAAWRALFPRHGWDRPRRWFILTGIFFGCALLSKYTAVLLFPSLILAVLFSQKRHVLFSANLLWATLAATIVFSPVILWNYQHDWVSFAFQFRHGIAEEKIFNSKYLLEFIGAQAGVLSPLVFLGLLYALVRFVPDNLREDRLAFFFWPCVFPLLFFTHAAMFKRAAANWAIPAYISGIIILAYWAARQDWRRWKLCSLALALLVVFMLKVPEVFPFLPQKAVMQSQFDGEVQIFKQLHLQPGVGFLGDSYGMAALAVYYLPQPSPVWVLTAPRVSMFDYWQKGQELPKEALYIGRWDEKERLAAYYKQVERQPDIEYKDTYLTERFFVYKVKGPVKAVF